MHSCLTVIVDWLFRNSFCAKTTPMLHDGNLINSVAVARFRRCNCTMSDRRKGIMRFRNGFYIWCIGDCRQCSDNPILRIGHKHLFYLLKSKADNAFLWAEKTKNYSPAVWDIRLIAAVIFQSPMIEAQFSDYLWKSVIILPFLASVWWREQSKSWMMFFCFGSYSL